MLVLPSELLERNGQKADAQHKLDEEERFHHETTPPRVF